MEDKKIQKGIDGIKKITMTALEKKQIFEYVINSETKTQKPVLSLWVNPFAFMTSKNHLAYFVIVPLIIILSGGVVFASENSLPDGLLYPIKVSVVEPVRESLIFNPKTKAEYESNLAVKRLVEAETLAGRGKLNKNIEKKLNNLLDKHTNNLNNNLSKINSIDQTEQTDEIITNFHANMNAHARVLDMIEGNPEAQSKDNQISNTARNNADKVENVSKNNNKKDKGENKPDKYKKRKEEVQSMINNTSLYLDNVSVDSSSSKREIIKDTNKTLNEARQFMDQADKHEEDGKQDDAYSKLLDSESSIKEADIFLKAGLKIEGEEKDSEY